MILALGLSLISGAPRSVLALRPAQDATAKPCKVEVKLPCMVCTGKTEDAEAKGTPAGGTFEWTISAGAEFAELSGTSGPKATVKGKKEGKFTLKVVYTADKKTCDGTVQGAVGDEIVMDLCAHLVKDKNGANGTTRTAEQVKSLVDDANKIWECCCIRFNLKETGTTKAPDNLADGLDLDWAKNDFTELRDLLKLDRAGDKCINVYFVNDIKGARGATDAPGTANPGMAIRDNGTGRTTAHELGHFNSLPHTKGDGGLMDENTADNKTQLTPEQCEQARKAARDYLK